MFVTVSQILMEWGHLFVLHDNIWQSIGVTVHTCFSRSNSSLLQVSSRVWEICGDWRISWCKPRSFCSVWMTWWATDCNSYVLLSVIECDEPYVPANGRVRIRWEGVRCYAVYECDDGYNMQGTDRLPCNQYGHWEGEEPECIGKNYYHLFVLWYSFSKKNWIGCLLAKTRSTKQVIRWDHFMSNQL